MMALTEGRRRYRRCLLWIFLGSLVFTAAFIWYYMERQVPDRLSIIVQEEESFTFALPFDMTLSSESEEVVLGTRSNIPADQIRLRGTEEFSLYSSSEGSYRLALDLFGTIRFKEIEVEVVNTQYVVPCGVPVGIYLQSDGIMVIGTGRVRQMDGQETEPAYGILQSGDYIEAFNGEPLQSKEALIGNLNENGDEQALLRVRRDGKELEVSMRPVLAEDGSYKLGAWVRDDTQGIGTLTYVDKDGNFGALGHGISDSDTGELIDTGGGSLYETEILGIEKGAAGSPGVMAGVIYYGPGTQMGTVEKNTETGIFGKVNEHMLQKISGEAVEVGYRQDVKKGTACIRSSISGTVQDYEIEIQRVDANPLQKNKSLVIHITDPRLLELTGGIIQGMSGSPILQDGKLIGAVTHVFVQDSTRGYGILVEDMR